MSGDPKVVLAVKQLVISYDNNPLLHNVNFELKKGEVLTILGENGSGKSSLAKAIAGLVPYKGAIWYDQHDLATFTHKERVQKISYIPARLKSYDTQMRVEEFVLMGRFVYKKSLFSYANEDREKVLECLRYLGIEHLAKQSLQTLSSGQEQLVLIASVLVQESDVIIFDEPTANLDPKNSVVFAQVFKQLQQTHALILITHDIALAKHLHSKVLFLEEQTAFLYEEDFFTPQTLERHYKVGFSTTNEIGVCFA